MDLPRPSRKKKGGREYCYPCPNGCKGKVNPYPLEVNRDTGLYHCWICGMGGRLEVVGGRKRLVPVVHDTPTVSTVPESLYPVLSSRGLDPEVVVPKYRVGWDGSRLCFPVEGVYWRRSPFRDVVPKVVVDRGVKGVLGSHLLYRGCYPVITEGDYKACSIPSPWIGLGIGGTYMTPYQVDVVLLYSPTVVTVCLDGGVDPRKVLDAFKGRRVECRVLRLREGLGPDDVPPHERVRLLMEGA